MPCNSTGTDTYQLLLTQTHSIRNHQPARAVRSPTNKHTRFRKHNRGQVTVSSYHSAAEVVVVIGTLEAMSIILGPRVLLHVAVNDLFHGQVGDQLVKGQVGTCHWVKVAHTLCSHTRATHAAMTTLLHHTLPTITLYLALK